MEARRTIIYTTNILEKLYNLKTCDIKEIQNQGRYAGTTFIKDQKDYLIGILDKNKDAHILGNDEVMMIEIMLNWESVLKEKDDLDCNDIHGTLLWEDIDWIKNRKMRNKEYLEQNHIQYKKTLDSLNQLMIVYGSRNNIKLYKLVNLKYLQDNKGVEYNFNILGCILKELNQRISIDLNAFSFSNEEFMKYQILRYIVSSIYMCRMKKRTFSRTHKSILNALHYVSDKFAISYFDYYIQSEYTKKYLKRYFKRLKEVMDMLVECKLIKNYEIIPDDSKRSLMTACGKVVITLSNIKLDRKYKVG